MPAWSGLWDDVYGQPYAPINQRMVLPRRIGMSYVREGMAADAAIAKALNGAAAGGTATATRKQVEALQSINSLGLGGARVIETKTIINRATTAADETAVDAMIEAKFAPTTYPVDASGNGGGGKTSSLT